MTDGDVNCGIAMGGYIWWIFGFKNYHIDHTTLHEVLHTYGAEHIPQSGYIMSESGYSNDMHSDTYSAIVEEKYDGWGI